MTTRPVLYLLALLALPAPAMAQTQAQTQGGWRPSKAVEIILPTAAGGANDNMARLIQKCLQEHRIVQSPMVVMNKAGGNQTLAAVYLRQNAKDPHYLLYSTSTVFTAHITGLSPQNHSDLAPIALLMTEYSVFSVRPDSQLKSVRDLAARLRADPQSVSFGVVSLGGANHIALSQVARAHGINPRQLRVVVFKTNVESYLALAGGHVQAVASSASAVMPFLQQGSARILAIAAPQRQAGALAQVPTLRDEGLDIALTTNWRGVFAAPGISTPQVAFWEEAFTRMVATEDWKKAQETGEHGRQFLAGHDFRKFLDKEYQATRAVLTDLGYAKQP